MGSYFNPWPCQCFKWEGDANDGRTDTKIAANDTSGLVEVQKKFEGFAVHVARGMDCQQPMTIPGCFLLLLHVFSGYLFPGETVCSEAVVVEPGEDRTSVPGQACPVAFQNQEGVFANRTDSALFRDQPNPVLTRRKERWLRRLGLRMSKRHDGQGWFDPIRDKRQASKHENEHDWRTNLIPDSLKISKG